jgi:hypothetical protein
MFSGIFPTFGHRREFLVEKKNGVFCVLHAVVEIYSVFAARGKRIPIFFAVYCAV